MCFDFNSYVALFIGIHHAGVRITAAHIVPHEQVTVSVFSPVFLSQHVWLALDQCSTGL